VPPNWKAGDRLSHRHSPELGVGRVAAVEGRTLLVEFPNSGVTLRLAAASDALLPVDLRPGRRVRIGRSGPEAAVAEPLPGDRFRLDDGREAAAEDLWPLQLGASLVERLASGELDAFEDFANRLDALHLSALREAAGLGSFLGGRIRLFPHQLHVAESAAGADPVRWLLADEVGLGKTVEAGLILSRLVRTRRVERCLIVAPESLVVQWLGELWRKYHQVFVLLDAARLADVLRDFGPGFNPFDAHRRVVVSLETLVERTLLTQQAVAAGIDLLVVDEAHRLRRPPGHPGNSAWRAVAPIAGLGRHVLLLTATPLEDDAHGFFRLLQLLRPDEFPEREAFEMRLARGEPLPRCTSSTRRADIGGLPPRVGVAVEVDDAEGWRRRLELEAEVRRAPADGAVARRAKAERVRRALASGAALAAVLEPDALGVRRMAERADAGDPRLTWLAEQARRWKAAGEKTLVFVAHRETLELVRTALSHRVQLATAAFHEQLATGRRDIEVARFRRPDGPSLLVCTESGGEGRNFEFCHRLVLFDMPWNPLVLEQRIGRLDRIGRRLPVEIVYFRAPAGLAVEVARLHEAIGVFQEPLAGLEPELAGVEAAIEEAALQPEQALTPAWFEATTREADAARERVRAAAYRELHRDRYRPERAAGILARVPAELDALNEQVVVTACERLGLHVERSRGRRTWAIELGAGALVESLPGVPGGSSFLGTFDREAALEDETLDFFAAGHPLVEGVLTDLEESPRGRVTALRVEVGAERELGLVALYKDGPTFEAVAVDARGRRRSAWEELLRTRPLRAASVSAEALRGAGWSEASRRLVGFLDAGRRPAALAALLVSPRGGARSGAR
jgi:ATP-dependent helicase HepA